MRTRYAKGINLILHAVILIFVDNWTYLFAIGEKQLVSKDTRCVYDTIGHIDYSEESSASALTVFMKKLS